jgi:hypothetical protein
MRGVVLSLASIDPVHAMMMWLGMGNVHGVLMRAGSKKGTGQEVLLLRAGVVGSQLLVQASPGHPSSCANSLTSSQVLRRSTAIRWNFREYRFRFTFQPFPCKVCPSWLSHFKRAVHFPNLKTS